MKRCFPGMNVPELHLLKTWSKDKKLPISLWFALRDRVTEQAAEFGWRHVKKAAEDFSLPIDQVGISGLSLTQGQSLENRGSSVACRCLYVALL